MISMLPFRSAFLVMMLALMLPLAGLGQEKKEKELTAEQQELLKRASALNAEMRKLYGQRKFAAAIPVALEALKINKEVLGEKHPNYASSLNNLAAMYQSSGQSAKAEPLYLEALKILKEVLGEEHPNYASSLNNLAFLYNSSGQYAKAEPLLLKALKIRKEVLGVKHSSYVDSLNNLAAMYQSSGQSAKAEPLYLEALKIRKEVLGEKHPDYATSLNNLVALYRSSGQYAKAEPLYLEALKILKEVLGEKHPDYADSLNNLAGLYNSSGQSAKAESLYLEALKIRKEVLGEKHPDYASSLNNLAGLYRSSGQPAKAEPMYLEALKIRKEILGEKHPDYAGSLNNLAGLYHSSGQSAKAEPLFIEALKIQKEVLGEKHPDYATSLNNLGLLYKSSGQSAKAEPLYREALKILKEVLGEEHPDYATSLNNLAGLYYSSGQYAKAEPLLIEGLKIRKEVLGEKHPNYADSLNNLAELYRDLGQSAKAESLYLEALKIRKEVLGEKHPDYASSLNNLAGLYRSSGQPAKAEPMYLEALKIQKEVLGEKHPDYADSLNNLAGLYNSSGQSAKAESLYLEALKIRKEVLGEKHPNYASSLNNLAGLYDSSGQSAKAEHLSLKAVAIIAEHLESNSEGQSEAAQLAFASSLRGYLYNLLIGTTKSTSPKIYDAVLRLRGAVTQRQLFLRSLRNSKPELKPLIEVLQKTSGEMTRLSTMPYNPKSNIDISAQLKKLEEQRQLQEAELARKSDVFAAYQKRKKLTGADLQKLIPKDSVLVEFLQYQDKLCAFVVDSKQIQRVELGDMKPIETAVEAFREQILSDTLKKTDPKDDPAKVLREKLWEPIQKVIGKPKIVLISPDGALCRLPFAALPGSDPKKYLLDEMAIVTIPIPSMLPDLLAPREDAKNAPSMLALGDIDFGNPPKKSDQLLFKGSWPALAGTVSELAAVTKTFKGASANSTVTELRKEKARKTTVRTEAEKHEYLHFATHGFFAPEGYGDVLGGTRASRGMMIEAPGEKKPTAPNPALLSGIVLSGANEQRTATSDDGILTALEVAELDLTRCEMVVLSACETGLGNTAGGEGVMGLQRAFHLAGTRTALTSLWKVDDKATEAMMTRFYGNIFEKKMGRLDALIEAQKWIMNEGPKNGFTRGVLIERTEPKEVKRAGAFYWGAFVLSGDWR